ncbi:holo-[acyl-carrier-protein] synthase [Anoxybacter fermentans]|uniref:Holo-[acyl-carrier-protein] synthase n=1 Tax=Anoxybacter fermentans TaxID=1323375 RepID=A0A3Q9HND8_9FIRM|nr:holo-ACP synthase [Anoxybacter fermentans]AZR71975.1 holo-[acyl-carrier-protein] synthase [Anoxybacter fermentans]
MIKGIGIDIVENIRFEKLLEKEDRAFFNRVFTEGEQEYCEKFKTMRLKAQHYAVRFAAKEALVKALGTGFRQIIFHEMEVKNDSLGAPFFEVRGRVKDLINKKKIKKIHLSLSHSDHYSTAMVVLEGKEDYNANSNRRRDA